MYVCTYLLTYAHKYAPPLHIKIRQTRRGYVSMTIKLCVFDVMMMMINAIDCH